MFLGPLTTETGFFSRFETKYSGAPLDVASITMRLLQYHLAATLHHVS